MLQKICLTFLGKHFVGRHFIFMIFVAFLIITKKLNIICYTTFIHIYPYAGCLLSKFVKWGRCFMETLSLFHGDTKYPSGPPDLRKLARLAVAYSLKRKKISPRRILRLDFLNQRIFFSLQKLIYPPPLSFSLSFCFFYFIL